MTEFTIDEALSLGIEAHKNGRIQEADRYYTAILDVNPDHPDANHNLGLIAVRLGKIKEAIPLFNKAIDVNSKVEQYWISLVEAHTKLNNIEIVAEITAEAKKNGHKLEVNHKEEDFSKSEDNNFYGEEPSKGQLQELIDLFNLGDFNSVLVRIGALLTKFPRSKSLYNISGASNAALGHYEDAIDNYNMAIKVAPTYPNTYYNMGVALYEQGNLEAALSSYKNATRINPSYIQAYNNMGNIYKERGQLKDALISYKRAIDISGKYANGHNNCGIILKDMKHFDEAIKNFEKAIAIQPDHYDAHNNLGNTFQEIGDYDSALASYKKAIELKPRFDEALFNIAVTFRKKGNKTSAKKYYRQVLKINPKHTKAQHLLASLTGHTTIAAPKDYVEDLFDAYSSNFEEDLKIKLGYKVPEYIFALMTEAYKAKKLSSILELGCGTGLVGLKISKLCKKIDGIDLSGRMLQIAASKNIYENLIQTEITDYLKEAYLDYDAFVAADVFTYIGDLSKIFQLIKTRNKRQGSLLFSTEHNYRCNFVLEESGRYSHSKEYIEYLCKKYGYTLESFEILKIRKQKGKFINGGVYFLKFNNKTCE